MNKYFLPTTILVLSGILSGFSNLTTGFLGLALDVAAFIGFVWATKSAATVFIANKKLNQGTGQAASSKDS